MRSILRSLLNRATYPSVCSFIKMKLPGNSLTSYKWTVAHVLVSQCAFLQYNTYQNQFSLQTKKTSLEMILSTLFDKKHRYEMTTVEEIRIEPTFSIPSASSDPLPGEEQLPFDFDSQRIVNNGHGVYWIEENYSSEENEPMTLPGSVEDDLGEIEVDSWIESIRNPEEVSAEPVFNLLPNGRRRRSFRSRVRRTFFRRSHYRRAAYAVDSRRTKLADGIAECSRKFKRFISNTMERLSPNETSWTNLEDLFTGTNNQFIPLLAMNPFTGLST